jgi:hypothetical protein
MPLRILLAVKSCRRDAESGANQAIRETWGSGLDDLRFFVGVGSHTKPFFPAEADTLILDCGDSYEDLPRKTRGILKFAIERAGREFIFLCDTDSYIIPWKLLASGFERFDLMGHIGGNLENGKYFPWPSGGAGYWLSSRAARIVVDAPVTNEVAEDRMVGQILGPHILDGGLAALNHPGYHRIYPDDEWRTDITTHFCARGMGRTYDPEWMRRRYRYNVLD